MLKRKPKEKSTHLFTFALYYHLSETIDIRKKLILRDVILSFLLALTMKTIMVCD